MRQVIIVGAGQAGASCAAKLRTLGFDGAITVIGEEPAPPYQRPPLSKAYLLGDIGPERLWLRSNDFWAEHRIDLRLDQLVLSIDIAARKVHLDGDALPYDELVLATGSAPRRLPAAIGGELDGVYTVRTLADVDRMREEFSAGRKLVVIGGGYIGLEAAAVGRKLGLDVTVVEAAPRILQRVASVETADYFRNLHRAHGAEILEGVGVDRLIGDGRVSAVHLTDGRQLPADFVVAGIGITPCDALASAAGIVIENGIRTNAHGRTSDPHVWAAGDCASFPLNGQQVRLESVGNAIDQAELVAANILGAAQDYVAKPWFWSDQYDCKLQIAGLNTGYDRTVVRPGAGAASSVWYFSGDKLLAVDAMNDPRAFMIGKRLIEAGRTVEPEVAANPATDLKSLLN